jgi:hypothetical protein
MLPKPKGIVAQLLGIDSLVKRSLQANGLSTILMGDSWASLLLGPLIEEVIKTQYTGTALVCASEFTAKGFAWQTCALSVFHIATSYFLPFTVRLGLHYAVNIIPRIYDFRREEVSRWVQWKASVHDEFIPNRVFESSERLATPFSPDTAFVPRLRRPVIPNKKKQCSLTVLTHSPHLGEDVALRGGDTAYFWPVNVPLYAASVNGAQLLGAVTERIMAEHPNLKGQSQYYDADFVLDFVSLYIVNVQDPIVRTPELVQEYIQHFPPNKAKCMAAYNELYERHRPALNDKVFKTTKLKIKADEHLVRPSGEFKARTIANVEPLVQLAIGPILREATRRLHVLWDLTAEPIQLIRGETKWILFPLFCTGWTDQKLGAIIEAAAARTNSIHIAVVGDDSIVVVNHNGELTFYWADFSAFDQSQGPCVLWLEYAVLRALGCEQDVCDMLRHISAVPYKFRDGSGNWLKVDRFKRPSRDTGAPDTTIGNSISNMSAWTCCIDALIDGVTEPTVFESLFLQLGFKIKLGCSTDVRDASFLKGMFYRLPSGAHVWGPLPSRFLKIGKCITDPRTIYQIPDLSEACLRHAASLAATYRMYSQVPLLNEFVRRFTREGVESAHRQIEFMVTGTSQDLLDPLLDVAAYYKIDPVWFVEAERMLRDAPLFTFFEHPLFNVLARDYN